jgi:hypothetical protein
MVRATVNERIQVGVEVTSGTGVSANKRLMGLDSLTLQPSEPQGRHRSAGSEGPSGVSLQKVHSTFEFEGPFCFLTVPYLFSSMWLDQASSPYTYTPDPYGVDDIKTLTIEAGNDDEAEKAAYGVTTNVRIRANQSDVTVNGGGFARKLSLGITPTATPTVVGKALADPALTSVLIGTTVGGLAEVNHLEVELNYPARWAPHFTLNVATDSYDSHKKLAGEPTITLTLESSAALADVLHGYARAKTKCFVRIILGTADEYSAGNTYEAQFTHYCTVEAPQRADKDAVFGATFILHPEPHADTGDSWVEAIITNGGSL